MMENNPTPRFSSDDIDKSLGEWQTCAFPMLRRGVRVKCKAHQKRIVAPGRDVVLTLVAGPFSQMYFYVVDNIEGTYRSMRLTPEMVMSLLDYDEVDDPKIAKLSKVAGGVVQVGQLVDLDEDSRRRIGGK